MTTWVLLRGLARGTFHWGDFPGQLRQQAPAGHEVIALDLPGNGALCQQRSPWRIGELVASVRDQLARRQVRPPYIPLTISMGSMVALEWAREEPSAVLGCVLINSSIAGLSPFWQRLRPRAWLVAGRLLLPGGGQLARESAILRLTTTRKISPELARQWAAHAAQCPPGPPNMLRQLTACARYAGPQGGPRVPLLLLASRRDRVVAIDCSRAMARAWRATLREHPWAGHDLPLDDGQWVIEHACAWAATLQPAGAGGSPA